MERQQQALYEIAVLYINWNGQLLAIPVEDICKELRESYKVTSPSFLFSWLKGVVKDFDPSMKLENCYCSDGGLRNEYDFYVR